MMVAMRWIVEHRAALALLGVALAVRLALAFVVAPGVYYAEDIGLLRSWATTLADVGPSGFYATQETANYPPVYPYVLWGMSALAGLVGGTADIGVGLLKVPAMLVDVGIGALLYVAGRRWFGTRAGLVAAGVYLFIPVTWYDSALWGQMDAVGTIALLAAIVLLVEGWSEGAAVLAVLAILVKPQYAIGLAVVVPVLLHRHVLAIGSGPRPSPGGRLGRLRPLLDRQGPERLLTSTLAAVAVALVVILPFDLSTKAPPDIGAVPAVGDVVGLANLFLSGGDRFTVLSANAYNLWALVGPQPIAYVLGPPGAAWTPESLAVLGGVPAVAVGAALLVGVWLLVFAGLLVRDGRLAILLGISVLAFAIYGLPTRVHERYLLPFFGVASLLAAPWATARVAVVLAGLLNTVNVHAVLGRSLAFDASRNVELPMAEFARSEPVIAAVAVGQTLLLAAFLVAWLVVLVAPGRLGDGADVLRPSGPGP